MKIYKQFIKFPDSTKLSLNIPAIFQWKDRGIPKNIPGRFPEVGKFPRIKEGSGSGREIFSYYIN